MITRSEILMGREVEYPLTPKLEDNLSKLLTALNRLRGKYGKPMVVSSGYRPGTYNTKAGGALSSSHITCEAVDFHDRDRHLTTWIMANPTVLLDCDLYMEEPGNTPTWVHLQVRPTKNRIFKP